MAMELSSERAICSRCGMAFSRRKGYFPVSYAELHKGIGHVPVCKECIDTMYDSYLGQCGDARLAVRQMCRKLDLYWNDSIFDIVSRKSTTRTMMTQYIAKINSVTYAGRSYDNTLSEEGMLWKFGRYPAMNVVPEQKQEEVEEIVPTITIEDIPEQVRLFWGSGYTPEMYQELEQRRQYWMSRFPDGTDLDIGTEALIRQICSLELDINRDRAAGKTIDKSVTALNTLLGSANLKPVQKKQEDADLGLNSTPLGVWLYRYENQRPLPEIDEELKDVNGIRRYVFTWMGHLCKMLGLKNAYSKLYEDEIERLRVEKPEYDGDDDELYFSEMLSDGVDGDSL